MEVLCFNKPLILVFEEIGLSSSNHNCITDACSTDFRCCGSLPAADTVDRVFLPIFKGQRDRSFGAVWCYDDQHLHHGFVELHFHLVLLSNRWVPSTVSHRRGESGDKQRRCLSGVQGCHPRPRSRTQRLTVADTAVTSASPKSVPVPHEAVGHTRAGSCRSVPDKTHPSCAAGHPSLLR